MGMIVFWTMTPLDYSAWVDDEIVSKRDGVNIDYITADVEENCIEHGKRGLLEHRNIERMIVQYPPEEREARAFGKFGHLLGRVHKSFEAKIHIIQPFKITYEDFCVYEALDTHPRVNDAVLWLAVDRNGQKYLIDELWCKMTTAQFANAIKAKSAGWRIIQRIIDPSAFIVDARIESGRSIAMQMEDYDLFFDKGSKDLAGGIRRTDDALLYTEENGVLLRKSEIQFFKNCERTIWEIEKGYVWDNWQGRTADEKEKKAIPKDKDDHMMENLHRLLLIEPKFVPLTEEEQIHHTSSIAKILGVKGKQNSAITFYA
jgi:hypothetical protein